MIYIIDHHQPGVTGQKGDHTDGATGATGDKGDTVMNGATGATGQQGDRALSDHMRVESQNPFKGTKGRTGFSWGNSKVC